MGVKLQDTFVYSKNSTSRKPNSSLPLLFSLAAEITTPCLVSYNSITTSSSPDLPTESINEPVLPYSVKGYITTDKNLVTNSCYTYPPLKMEQCVPKRRHIKFRRRGITQKKAYNISYQFHTLFILLHLHGL